MGGKPNNHVTHMITTPISVQLEQTDLGVDSALQIKSADGTTALPGLMTHRISSPGVTNSATVALPGLQLSGKRCSLVRSQELLCQRNGIRTTQPSATPVMRSIRMRNTTLSGAPASWAITDSTGVSSGKRASSLPRMDFRSLGTRISSKLP